MPRTTRWAALPLAAIALSACAAEPDPPPQPSTSALIAEVAAASTRAATVTGTQVLRIPGNGTTRVDFTAQRVGPDPDVEYRLTRTPESGPGKSQKTVLLVRGALFAELPPPARPARWTHVAENDRTPASETDQLRHAGDPADQFAEIVAGGRVTASAQTGINGERATRYTISADPAQVAPRLSNMLLRSLLGWSMDAGAKPFDYDAWISADGRLLRAEYRVQLPNGTTAVGRDDLTGWGRPTNLTAPPDQQVAPR